MIIPFLTGMLGQYNKNKDAERAAAARMKELVFEDDFRRDELEQKESAQADTFGIANRNADINERRLGLDETIHRDNFGLKGKEFDFDRVRHAFGDSPIGRGLSLKAFDQFGSNPDAVNTMATDVANASQFEKARDANLKNRFELQSQLGYGGGSSAGGSTGGFGGVRPTANNPFAGSDAMLTPEAFERLQFLEKAPNANVISPTMRMDDYVSKATTIAQEMARIRNDAASYRGGQVPPQLTGQFGSPYGDTAMPYPQLKPDGSVGYGTLDLLPMGGGEAPGPEAGPGLTGDTQLEVLRNANSQGASVGPDAFYGDAGRMTKPLVPQLRPPMNPNSAMPAMQEPTQGDFDRSNLGTMPLPNTRPSQVPSAPPARPPARPPAAKPNTQPGGRQPLKVQPQNAAQVSQIQALAESKGLRLVNENGVWFLVK